LPDFDENWYTHQENQAESRKKQQVIEGESGKAIEP
jgi:hypothetical protein